MIKNLIVVFLLSSCSVFSQDVSPALNAFSKSYTFESAKQYSKAILELQNVYEQNSYEMNLRLGWLSYEAGQYNESVSYYQKAISIIPGSVEAKLGIVYPFSAQNNWDDVLNQYLSVLNIDPKNSLVNYRTALIYYNRKNFTEAKKHLDIVLGLYPFDYDSNLLLGWTNYSLQNKSGAESYFNKVLLYNPSDTSAKEGLRLCK